MTGRGRRRRGARYDLAPTALSTVLSIAAMFGGAGQARPPASPRAW
ncbi:MAG TPA: hypothetical protein VHC18_21105 [Amycolatopsis sp.]|nr:hypothetical protein [Amycolatopsis sp.]